MKGYRWVEETTKRVRLEFEAPVELKEIGIAFTWIHQKFEELNGRPPTHDNDYWLEPTDEGVAFVFEVTRAVAEAPNGA